MQYFVKTQVLKIIYKVIYWKSSEIIFFLIHKIWWIVNCQNCTGRTLNTFQKQHFKKPTLYKMKVEFQIQSPLFFSWAGYSLSHPHKRVYHYIKIWFQTYAGKDFFTKLFKFSIKLFFWKCTKTSLLHVLIFCREVINFC